MKKKIGALVMVCLLLWAGQEAFAQESKWRLGLRVSSNISLLSVRNSSGNIIDILNINKSTQIGFSGGLQVTYQFVEKFGLHTGLQVSSQGFTVNTRTLGNNDNALQQQKISLVMLQIPLALCLRTQELNNKMRVRGIFGSSFNIPVSATENFTYSDDFKYFDVSLEKKEMSDYAKIIPNFLVGAGIEWNLGSAGILDLGLSYQLPLAVTSNKIYDKKYVTGGYMSGSRFKLSYLSLDITYYF
ncbi:MAG: PorT family protein [Thermoflexibacter sp.]|jgi:hypothetical protein|nr:PorT family protein [Thermoflexibacter sp.]